MPTYDNDDEFTVFQLSTITNATASMSHATAKDPLLQNYSTDKNI